MKVFIEISQFASRSSAKELRSYVRQLEDLGAAGVIVWDHIFTSPHKGTTELFRPSDPMTTLAAVAGISDSLEVEAIVINCAWINPALLLRQWLQLAVFHGRRTGDSRAGTRLEYRRVHRDRRAHGAVP